MWLLFTYQNPWDTLYRGTGDIVPHTSPSRESFFPDAQEPKIRVTTSQRKGALRAVMEET
jgi:hypothetical protein